MAKETKSIKGKSQLDVCGAAMITNLVLSGILPSTRHPAIFNIRRERRGIILFSTGVSKIVWDKVVLPGI
jgi:hypothetical protein